jgi:hypothetical protein
MPIAIPKDSSLAGFGVFGQMIIGKYATYNVETPGGGTGTVSLHSFPEIPITTLRFEVGFDIRGRVVKHGA